MRQIYIRKKYAICFFVSTSVATEGHQKLMYFVPVGKGSVSWGNSLRVWDNKIRFWPKSLQISKKRGQNYMIVSKLFPECR